MEQFFDSFGCGCENTQLTHMPPWFFLLSSSSLSPRSWSQCSLYWMPPLRLKAALGFIPEGTETDLETCAHDSAQIDMWVTGESFGRGSCKYKEFYFIFCWHTMRQNKIDTIQNNFIKYHSHHILSDLQHSVHVRGYVRRWKNTMPNFSISLYTHSKKQNNNC